MNQIEKIIDIATWNRSPFTMILFGPESQESFWQRQLVWQRLILGCGIY